MNRCLNTTHVASRWRRACIHWAKREWVCWLAGIISAQRGILLTKHKGGRFFCRLTSPLKRAAPQIKTPRSSTYIECFSMCVLSAACAHPTVSAPSVYPHPIFYLLFCIIHIMERWQLAVRRPPLKILACVFCFAYFVHVGGDREYARNFLGAKSYQVEVLLPFPLQEESMKIMWMSRKLAEQLSLSIGFF